jgi:hypothetical protein
MLATLAAFVAPASGTTGCSLCGEGESVPATAKDVIASYECKTSDGSDVEGFEGSTEAECMAAGGSGLSSRTCGELETYLHTRSSSDETCSSHQEHFKLKCSCPGASGCSLCGEGESVPEDAKSRILGYECRKEDGSEVEGFEGSTAEECTGAGGSHLKTHTCKDMEAYLSLALPANHSGCSDSQSAYSLRC